MGRKGALYLAEIQTIVLLSDVDTNATTLLFSKPGCPAIVLVQNEILPIITSDVKCHIDGLLLLSQ